VRSTWLASVRAAFCAVGGHSPALWRTGGETPSGAFDDAEDFGRHDVFAAARSGKAFGRGPVWLDAGDSDPFLEATRALAGVLRDNGKKVELHVSPGGHDRGYWRRHTADYLRFYVSAFARC
jgi:enterochelin esterase-like enzyme